MTEAERLDDTKEAWQGDNILVDRLAAAGERMASQEKRMAE